MTISSTYMATKVRLLQNLSPFLISSYENFFQLTTRLNTTSNWWTNSSCSIDNAIRTLIAFAPSSGANVSSKSLMYCCTYLFETRLTFLLFRFPLYLIPRIIYTILFSWPSSLSYSYYPWSSSGTVRYIARLELKKSIVFFFRVSVW